MICVLYRLWRDESAATAIEYGLLVAAISIAIIVALNAFGDSLNSLYDLISGSIDEEVKGAQGN